MRYTITAYIGSEFYHGPAIRLGRSRWRWLAKMRGRFYLYFYPHREVIITRP